MALTNAQILKIVELFNKYSDSNVPVEVLDNLKELVNDAYSAFNDRQIKMSTMGADDVYSNRRVCFVKVIWKVLMEWLWNPTVIPAPSNVYGALYNWHAATYINNTNVINGLLYNWYAVNSSNSIIYGYLYNWYAATDVRNIANTGWHVPAVSEWETLETECGGNSDAGGVLKETGIVYWVNPNVGATNAKGFNGRGSGVRAYNNGMFFLNLTAFYCWTSTELDALYKRAAHVSEGDNTVSNMSFAYFASEGLAIRLIKDSTALTDGQTGTYTGNDGKSYNTICIGTQEWVADNLAETKYRNGDDIPEVTNDAAWGALTTGARCSYDNDETNAFQSAGSLAPIGWHVAEWTELNNLEVSLTISALKEVGTDHWLTNNGTDDYDFHLRGSGKRNDVGGFGDIKNQSSLWASTSWDSNPVFWTVFDNLISGWSIGNNCGCSVRCVKDSTTLSIGDAGTMVDYDGNVYPTICMPDGKEWMAVNLAVTHYTDGILIPEVINNAAWEALSTGGRCAYSNDYLNVFETMEELAPTGWHVPTKTEFETLITFLGGEAIAGGALKETGFTYWDSPNAGATNSSGFSLQGSGIRGSEDGAFSSIKLYTVLLSNTEYILDTDQANDLEIPFDDDYAFIDAVIKGLGASLRLIKDSTTLSNGQSGVVTDIDGNIYPTICIGTQEWMAMNLNVTHYNNGTPIPNLTEDIDWINDLSGAMCWYNNNELQQ